MRWLRSERLGNWFGMLLCVGAAVFGSLHIFEGVTTGRYLFQNRYMTNAIEILWHDTPLLFAGFITVQIGLVVLFLELAWFGLYHIARRTQRLSGWPIRYTPKFLGGVVVGVGVIVALAEHAR
jgi:hypothetical protein